MIKKTGLGLFLLLIVVASASAQRRQVIFPPQFGDPAKDQALFSPGILDGDTLFVSGQLGADLSSGEIPKEFEAEVRTCLNNIDLVLKAARMDFSDVVSVQVFMTDMTQFRRMNVVYASMFKAPRPTRVTVGIAALAIPSARIEISVIARKRSANTN